MITDDQIYRISTAVVQKFKDEPDRHSARIEFTFSEIDYSRCSFLCKKTRQDALKQGVSLDAKISMDPESRRCIVGFSRELLPEIK